MDNASKNATDMIGRLQMQYNRGRQASITNELVDIITGSWLLTRFVRWITDARPRCQRLVISENSLESGIDSVARSPVISRSPNLLIVVWIRSPFNVAVTFVTRAESPTTPSRPMKFGLTACFGFLRISSLLVPVHGR